MKKLLAALVLLWGGPAFADGTINTLGAGGVLVGSEKIPMFQTANPAVTTTPSALSTFLASTSQVLTNKTVNCANNTCTVRLASDITGFGANVATALGVAVGTDGAFVVKAGALGTPSSGVATNLTGLPLTAGVTGNLSVNNLNNGTNADSSHYWRGDGTWATVASGSSTVTANGNTETGVTTFAFGTGFNVPGGASSSAAITLAVIPVTDSGATRVMTGTDGSKLIHMTNGAATTITLPDSATVTSKFGVNLVCDAGCTVNRAGADTVNGATSFVVPPKAWASIATDGAGVFLLGLGPGAVTGTGSMVQATSPTLVTPVLGTPTSGNAVNMTGYTVANLAGAGTGVVTAAQSNLSASGGLTTTIASGAKALATGAISSAACTSAQTDTATNTATTDVVLASFNGDPTGVTGYVPLTAGMLTIIAYPTTGTVNFKVCNNTTSSITPGAITLNWRVVR